MKSLILTNLLGKELIEAGFELGEDEDFVYLFYKGKEMSKYNGTKVTAEMLKTDVYCLWQGKWNK